MGLHTYRLTHLFRFINNSKNIYYNNQVKIDKFTLRTIAKPQVETEQPLKRTQQNSRTKALRTQRTQNALKQLESNKQGNLYENPSETLEAVEL